MIIILYIYIEREREIERERDRERERDEEREINIYLCNIQNFKNSKTSKGLVLKIYLLSLIRCLPKRCKLMFISGLECICPAAPREEDRLYLLSHIITI